MARRHIAMTVSSGRRNTTFDSRPPSARRRPSAASRAQSGVRGSAYRMLIVSIGIWEASMNSIRWSAVAGVSASRPRMMPETTSSPWSLIFRTASRIGMRRFWSLAIERRASGSGVSMPQNTTWKPASRISRSTRSFLAMLSVASHAKRTG